MVSLTGFGRVSEMLKGSVGDPLELFLDLGDLGDLGVRLGEPTDFRLTDFNAIPSLCQRSFPSSSKFPVASKRNC